MQYIYLAKTTTGFRVHILYYYCSDTNNYIVNFGDIREASDEVQKHKQLAEFIKKKKKKRCSLVNFDYSDIRGSLPSLKILVYNYNYYYTVLNYYGSLIPWFEK